MTITALIELSRVGQQQLLCFIHPLKKDKFQWDSTPFNTKKIASKFQIPRKNLRIPVPQRSVLKTLIYKEYQNMTHISNNQPLSSTSLDNSYFSICSIFFYMFLIKAVLLWPSHRPSEAVNPHLLRFQRRQRCAAKWHLWVCLAAAKQLAVLETSGDETELKPQQIPWRIHGAGIFYLYTTGWFLR